MNPSIFKRNIFKFLFLLLLVTPIQSPANEGLRGTKPNKVKETKCYELLARYGHMSYRINDDWYGKGVMRPPRKNWRLARIKKPNFLFGGDLYYVFYNETPDGFRHEAVCKFYGDFNEYEFYINHHTYGEAIMCTGDGAVNDAC